MKILNKKPSNKVGEIKKLLANKVFSGELKNQKEDLSHVLNLLINFFGQRKIGLSCTFFIK